MASSQMETEKAVWPPQPVRENRRRQCQEFIADELHFRQENNWPVSRRELVRALRQEYHLAPAEAREIVRAYCDAHQVLPRYRSSLLMLTWVTLLVGFGSFGVLFGQIMQSLHHMTPHSAAMVSRLFARGFLVLATTLGVVVVLTVTGDLLDLRHRKGRQKTSGVSRTQELSRHDRR